MSYQATAGLLPDRITHGISSQAGGDEVTDGPGFPGFFAASPAVVRVRPGLSPFPQAHSGRPTRRRSTCAARAKGVYEKAAAERRAATLKQNANTDRANLPERDSTEGRSRDQSAKAFGVGGRTVDYASKVIETANLESRKMHAGDKGVSTTSTVEEVALPDMHGIDRAEEGNLCFPP